MSEEIVHFDSDQAATYRTDIKGWVSRFGMYFGDDLSAEESARYHGCTHKPCRECGTPTTKTRLWCGDCESCRRRKKWAARDEVEWDGKSYLFSDRNDTYYDPDLDMLFLDMVDMGLTRVRDMALIQCEPNYVPELDSSFAEDVFPEDADEDPPELAEAIAQFNEKVKGLILSWGPGPDRVKTDTPFWKKFEQELIEKFAEDENE